MKLFDVYGRLKKRSVAKYLIDWKGDSLSKMQFTVKQFLKPFWVAHVVYEEFPVFGTRMKVDILNMTKRIAVEVNGDQHHTFSKFFHDNSRVKYAQSIARDYKKAKWLELNDFELIEIQTEDMKKLSEKYIKETFGIEIL